jgi:hypothetical protein
MPKLQDNLVIAQHGNLVITQHDTLVIVRIIGNQ